MSVALMTSQSVAIRRLGGGVSVAVSGRHTFKAALVLVEDVQIAQMSEGAAFGNAIPH